MLKGLAYKTKVLFYEVYIFDRASFDQHPFRIKVGGNAQAKLSPLHTDIATLHRELTCTNVWTDGRCDQGKAYREAEKEGAGNPGSGLNAAYCVSSSALQNKNVVVQRCVLCKGQCASFLYS
jgi:hypothetical protein